MLTREVIKPSAECAPQQFRGRVFRLRARVLDRTQLHISVLAIGCIVSWTVGYVFTMGLIFMLPSWPGGPPAWSYMGSAILALGAVYAWARIMSGVHWGRVRSLYRYRIDRLEPFIAHPQTTHRYPHRLIEWQWLKGGERSYVTAKLASVAPGNVIVVSDRATDEAEASPMLSQPFEPIALSDLSAQIGETGAIGGSFGYLRERYRALMQHSRMRQERNRRKRSKPSSHLRQRLTSFNAKVAPIGQVLYFTFLGWFVLDDVYDMVLGRDFQALASWGVLLLALLGGLWIWAMFRRQWWVVPGGLIYREYVWRKRDWRGGFVTRDDSPFYVDLANSRGAIVDCGRVLWFSTVGAQDNIYRAWLSPAEPPTREQVASFLGE